MTLRSDYQAFVASGSFGRNAAIYPRSHREHHAPAPTPPTHRRPDVGRAQRPAVGQINTALLTSNVAQALAKSINKNDSVRSPTSNVTRIRFDADQIQAILARRTLQQHVETDGYLNHASAADVNNGVQDDVSITNATSDYLLNNFVVTDDMEGWDVDSFYVGRTIDRIQNGKPMRATIFAASVMHMLAQMGIKKLMRQDIVTLKVTNRTGAPSRFRATWLITDLNEACDNG